MSSLLVNLFIKDKENVNDLKVRTAYGILSGITGIILNLILCAAKFAVGSLTGSIAITADAANNLSDAGSSVVTVFGFKLSGKASDEDHPFGHGRIEYIAALIVSFFIIFMSYELGRSSVEKILNPEPVKFSVVSAVIIAVSILGKVWLAFFNNKLGKKINSAAMTAVVKDSIGDIAATSITLIALILSKFTSLPIDGYLGIIVSLFVLYAGIGILKETVGTLLGKPPEKEFVNELETRVLSYDGVVGIHDLMVHDYGPGRLFASVHIEVPADVDITVSHDVADIIEKEVGDAMGMTLVAHIDPIETDNDTVNEPKAVVAEIIKEFDSDYTFHDFRVVQGPTHTNLIFDLVVPHKHQESRTEIGKKLSAKINEYNPTYFSVITVEHSFV